MPKPPAVPSSTRRANGRFGAGNPGRPRGARNRVAQRVAFAILEDFEAHQEAILPDLRKYKMSLYLRLVSRLLPVPADVGLPDFADFDDDELAIRIADLRDALDCIEKGKGTLFDLEGVLVREFAPEALPAP